MKNTLQQDIQNYIAQEEARLLKIKERLSELACSENATTFHRQEISAQIKSGFSPQQLEQIWF